jgi:hypothetical protein
MTDTKGDMMTNTKADMTITKANMKFQTTWELSPYTTAKWLANGSLKFIRRKPDVFGKIRGGGYKVYVKPSTCLSILGKMNEIKNTMEELKKQEDPESTNIHLHGDTILQLNLLYKDDLSDFIEYYGIHRVDDDNNIQVGVGLNLNKTEYHCFLKMLMSWKEYNSRKEQTRKRSGEAVNHPSKRKRGLDKKSMTSEKIQSTKSSEEVSSLQSEEQPPPQMEEPYSQMEEADSQVVGDKLIQEPMKPVRGEKTEPIKPKVQKEEETTEKTTKLAEGDTNGGTHILTEKQKFEVTLYGWEWQPRKADNTSDFKGKPQGGWFIDPKKCIDEACRFRPEDFTAYLMNIITRKIQLYVNQDMFDCALAKLIRDKMAKMGIHTPVPDLKLASEQKLVDSIPVIEIYRVCKTAISYYQEMTELDENYLMKALSEYTKDVNIFYLMKHKYFNIYFVDLFDFMERISKL